MYYQNYEDYMRSVLGYPMERENTYETMQYVNMPYETTPSYSTAARYSGEVMELYPEIYKVVNPMVCKLCDANTKPITAELLDQMTDEIYLNLETEPEIDTVVNVRVNTAGAGEEGKTANRSSNTVQSNYAQNRNVKSKTENEMAQNRQEEKREVRQRRPRNNTLRDLIRILILNRLLGGFPGHRPPRPPMPSRPPMRPPYPRDDRYFI